MMRIGKTFILTLIFIFLIPCISWAQSINIPSDIPYILIDLKTGQVLAEQNADERIRPASTTKIMTAIVALENGDLGQEMTVSQNAVFDIGKGGMNIGIMAGEEGLTLDNMLHVLLIKSANEAANIIAENVAPSRQEFIDMMNQKAIELGALHTTFVNPSGKDTEKEDANHLTTARNMAIFARYAMSIPKFREIVSTEYYKDMPVTNKHDDWGILRNTNQLLWYDNTYPYTIGDTEYEYTVIGVKTGYTAAAGNNLVSAAVGVDGMELIAVVMHVTQPNKIYGYSKELLKYGFENFSYKEIAEEGKHITTVYIDNAAAQDAVLELKLNSGMGAVLPIDANVQDVKSNITINESIKAPIEKGDILGKAEYYYNDSLLGAVDIVASRSVPALPVQLAGQGSQSVAADSSYSFTLLYILLSACGLVILRSILKRISRRVKRRKYESI